MKMRVVAVALSMMLAAIPAKAADFITYQGFSSGTVTFFDHQSPAPPVTKATGYTFTFIVPLEPNVDPKAEVAGLSLSFRVSAQFEGFLASACLAQSTGGAFPTTSAAFVPGCGSVYHYVGKNSGFQFSGNLYDITAQATTGPPRSGGLIASDFFDIPPPAVPEPASWFMMVLGVGLIGASLRRRSVNVVAAQ
jgi:hypothetical protein